MRTIINYLNGIYKDLDKNISRMDDLCSLKTLNYSGGNLPDYSRYEIQQLYLLRYAFAYIYEYSLMYDQAIRALHTCSGEISVTSLGCGAMIDYLGLREVLIINNKKRVIYTGVDLIDWNYKVSTYVEDHIEFYPGICADKYFDGLYVLDSDIYIFPKSISEISKETIEKIALNFKKKPNLKDRFSLCVSLRSNESNKYDDMEKVKMIKNGIINNGYKLISNIENDYKTTENRGITYFKRSYRYPENIIANLINMGDRCGRRYRCLYSNTCKGCINRYPILRTGEICYKVITFERSAA